MTRVDPRRRKLLKLGLSGAILLTGGGLFGWRFFGRGYAHLLSPGDTPIGLSDKEFAIIKAFTATLLPAADGFPAGEALGVPQRIDQEVWVAPPELRRDLKAGVQLLEHATVWNGFSSRFTRLAPSEQRAYIEKLLAGSNNTLCLVALAFKEMAYLFYYGNPAVWQHIGYDGPLVQKAVPPETDIAYQALLQKRAAT